jgi:hypothetical protein
MSENGTEKTVKHSPTFIRVTAVVNLGGETRPCVLNLDGGVTIRKEGNSLALALADAEDLVIKLDDYLKGLER